VLNTVSKRGATLSLYAPKFNLSKLGSKNERIVLRIVLGSATSTVTVFANYVVGRKEAQVATQSLGELSEVGIMSVRRYEISDLVSDATRYFKESEEIEFALVSDGKSLKFRIGEREIPASAREMYASGGEAYLVIRCGRKEFRIVTGRNGAKIFDLQRRRIVGLEIQDNKIVLQRAFQHADLAGIAKK
jgi:hypothetical protein